MSIQYYLLPNTATADPNDCYALVVTRDNLDNDALAQELVQRGAATSKAQALAVLAACQEIIAQKVAEGYAINTPLFTARPGINGVFTNPTDTFDPARHTIVGNLSGGPLLREQLGGASTEKILRPAPRPRSPPSPTKAPEPSTPPPHPEPSARLPASSSSSTPPRLLTASTSSPAPVAP